MEQVSQETLSPYWVTGLSDGEASFTYSRHRGGNGITNYYAVKLTRVERPIIGGGQVRSQ